MVENFESLFKYIQIYIYKYILLICTDTTIVIFIPIEFDRIFSR